MAKITLEDYFAGRDAAYPLECSPIVRENAQRTVEVVNAVLDVMESDGIVLPSPLIASGWRPRVVNDKTSNAAHKSKHITAQACDLHDTSDRQLARWALENEDVMKDLGVLGIERPQWTPTWLHIQTVAAISGHWCYIPSSAAPIAQALPDEPGTAPA